MKPTRRIPTPTTIREAQAALRELAPLIQGRGRAQRAVRVSAEGVVGAHPVNVLLLAFKLFLEILGQLASGNAAA